MSIHSHRSLNRVYTKEKIVAPATLSVFLKYYCHFILFYKPLQFFDETQRWIQLLLQRLEESNIKEKNISVEQLTNVLQQFEKEWDEDHIRDYNTILESHKDDDYEATEGEELQHVHATPEFEKIVTDFAREVIRYAPSELIKFAQRYFKALEAGKVEKYLQKMADQRAKLLPQRLCTEEDLARAQDYLTMQHGEVDDLDMNRTKTIEMIQKTLAAEAEERRARAQLETEEQAVAKRERDAEEERKQAELERSFAERSIDMDGVSKDNKPASKAASRTVVEEDEEEKGDGESPRAAEEEEEPEPEAAAAKEEEEEAAEEAEPQEEEEEQAEEAEEGGEEGEALDDEM